MEIRSGIYKLKSKGCNVYLLRIGEQKYLVDTGTPNNTNLLLSQIGSLDGILITHAHFDHVGSAGDLQARLDCPVYIHKDDYPYLMGEKKFRYGGVLGMVASLAERINRAKKPSDVRTIDTLNALSTDFNVIHTPGHTPGSVCILYKKCLICGDLIRYTKEYYVFGKDVIKLSPKSFCSNYSEYLKSVRSILDFDFDIILPGHGSPVYNAKEKLKSIL